MAVLVRSRHRGEKVEPRSGDFMLERGYAIERLAGGLTYVSNVEISPDGDIYFTEAGFSYPYVFTTPRLCRLNEDGTHDTISTAFDGPLIGLAWYEGDLLVTHSGALARVTTGGAVRTLVGDLPSVGDHHTNHIVVRNGEVYFGQGSVTNTGVVGPDNLLPYGWLAAHGDAHDVPPYDVTLAGLDFSSRDPFLPVEIVRTGAFLEFREYSMPGQVVEGREKATSAIYRADPDGGGFEVYCWGLRNPFALGMSPDARLWTVDQGADDRGSRPLPSKDAMYEVRRGAWYGFPDWFGGQPATVLADRAEIDNPHGFVLQDPPERTPPAYVFPHEHCTPTQVDFCRSEDFGHFGEAFVAEFGSGAPAATGGRFRRSGRSIVRLDLETMSSVDFYRNENPGLGGTGPERPVALRFSPDGEELLLADFGRLGVPGTGAIWRIRPE